MNGDRWIEVVDWQRFQHYRDRRPLWIKLYTELLDDDVFLALPEGTRLLLVELWLMYATTHGQLTDSTRTLSQRLRHRVFTHQLERLNEAGFIRFVASKPAALPLAECLPREREREETPLPPQVGEPSASKRAAGTNPRALAANAAHADSATRAAELHRLADELADTWNGGSSDDFATALDELERRTGAHLRALEREDLWDRVWQGAHDELF